MKRFTLVAAVVGLSACSNAAKEQARLDSIKADSTAKAVAAAAIQDSIHKADSAAAAAKAAASKSKTGAKTPATKGTRPKM